MKQWANPIQKKSFLIQVLIIYFPMIIYNRNVYIFGLFTLVII